MIKKSCSIILILCCSFFGFAQADSSQRMGTIKIVKLKGGPVYIKAGAEFGIKGPNRFQPFPVVEGHAFPFSYTKFFNDSFKNTRIDLQGKNSDTVYIQVDVSKNGKVHIKDISSSMINGKKSFYEGDGNKDMNALHLNCFAFLKEIKEWYPAYDIDPKVGKFKGVTAIWPVKTNRDATGIITIIFSTESFDE